MKCEEANQMVIRELATEMAKEYFVMLNCEDPTADWEKESIATREGYIMDEWFRAVIAVKYIRCSFSEGYKQGAGERRELVESRERMVRRLAEK